MRWFGLIVALVASGSMSCTGSEVSSPEISVSVTQGPSLVTQVVETDAVRESIPKTVPPVIDIEEVIRQVQSGEVVWRQTSLFSGVSVEEAVEWGERGGFTNIIVATSDDLLPLTAGPGRTLVIREADGVVRSVTVAGD